MAIRDNLKTGGSSKKLYEALQFSGLVTEEMTFAEMCEELAAYFPEILTLYKNGVNGGGFESFACTTLSHTPQKPSVTFAEGMTIKVSGTAGSSAWVYPCGSIISKEIDLTSFDTLKFNFSGAKSDMTDYSGNTAIASVFITENKTSKISAVASKMFYNRANGNNLDGVVELDIKSLNGKHYIGIELLSNGWSGKTCYTEVTINNMRLE